MSSWTAGMSLSLKRHPKAEGYVPFLWVGAVEAGVGLLWPPSLAWVGLFGGGGGSPIIAASFSLPWVGAPRSCRVLVGSGSPDWLWPSCPVSTARLVTRTKESTVRVSRTVHETENLWGRRSLYEWPPTVRAWCKQKKKKKKKKSTLR
eukprot:TRINITY_DN3059_c0_g1_i22.p1 TRINITY_DN3059_c0_g1~~TRINITY_DN3059_c0_g1_i22.p1  ORF type:complete len:148 (+),score=40.08 TRINITY_DN3059_c0_g1_i22:598-1041(+)